VLSKDLPKRRYAIGILSGSFTGESADGNASVLCF